MKSDPSGRSITFSIVEAGRHHEAQTPRQWSPDLRSMSSSDPPHPASMPGGHGDRLGWRWELGGGDVRLWWVGRQSRSSGCPEPASPAGPERQERCYSLVWPPGRGGQNRTFGRKQRNIVQVLGVTFTWMPISLKNRQAS